MTYKPTKVIYHGGCKDGFTAAWAIWQWLGNDAEYLPAFYGQPAPQVSLADDVLIVDFSYPKGDLLNLAENARSVVVLDHHKTAALALSDFAVPTPLNRFNIAERIEGSNGILATFDMSRSGAQLAWRFVNGDQQEPLLIAYVADHDLWKHRLDRSKEVAWALDSYSQDFQIWERLSRNVGALTVEGGSILRAARKSILDMMPQTRIVKIGPYDVPCLNMMPNLASEAAHMLLEAHATAPFAATWYRFAPLGETNKGKDGWSLRSEGHRIDVSKVAETYGGGGHRNAAGFSTWAGRFMDDIGSIPDDNLAKTA